MISLLLAVFTVVAMLLILVPTMIWVRLRAPWAKGMVEFLCLLPLTIPALVIVVGLRNVYLWVTYFLGESALTLTFVYVVLVLPFAYRAIDAALSSIDLKTLAEAARSLGAGWATTILRVVVPNIWSGILSAAFISIAVVLGEYTIASLSGYQTLQVQIVLIGKTDGPTSVAASLAVLLFGFVLLLVLSLVTRGRRRTSRPRRHRSPHPLEFRMTNGVAVELNDLTRVYGSVKALDGLTLHIEPGELVALLGPSGCGKTTALRILAGLDEATSGTVSVGGQDVSRVPANKRDMGMVFQAYSLFPHLTVLDNVAFGLKMRGKDKGERTSRADDMLELVGLSAHTAQVRQRAVGRPAAAGRAGPGAGDPAAGAAARRAALGAGRQGARAAARRDPACSARGRHDDAVRHARPGGGARRRRPGRRDEPGQARTARRARRALRQPGDAVRRGVRRPEQQSARGGFGWAGPAARHVGACTARFDQPRAAGWRWCGRSRSPSPPTRRAPPR